MAITRVEFYQLYPEFVDASKFPVFAVDTWIAAGYRLLNAQRFGDNLDLGVMLFTAHKLAKGARNATTAASGGIAGAAQGPVSSKTVDKVSVSYDTGATANERAGDWNATSYGQELFTMMRANSAGPVYRVPCR